MYRFNQILQWIVFIIILNPFSTLLLANHFLNKITKKISELLGRNEYLLGRKVDTPALNEPEKSDELYRKIMARSLLQDQDSTATIEEVVGVVKKPREVRRTGKRLTPEIEQRILDYSLRFPTQGQARVARELNIQGVQVSAGGVRRVWVRHNIQRASLRVKRLEQHVAESSAPTFFEHSKPRRIKRVDKNVIKVTPMTVSMFKDME